MSLEPFSLSPLELLYLVILLQYVCNIYISTILHVTFTFEWEVLGILVRNKDFIKSVSFIRQNKAIFTLDTYIKNFCNSMLNKNHYEK